MRVPTLDLKAQYDTIREDVLTAATKVFDSQGFILGKTVQDFEAACAEYTTAKHAVGVSSGTDAILIALMNEGIGHGDEVITTTFSFFATAGTIARTGATPVFVDIDPRTFNIDASQIEAKITPKTKAIVPVHLYGLPCDMDPINAIAKKHNLVVIEDAAQAIGAHDAQGRQVGTMGDYGCFSFFPSKNLGGAGDAGMTTTMDDARAEKLFKMRMHGEVRQYVHTFVGGNFRIDALQAAILHVKLPHLDSWTEGRQRNADAYRELLTERGVSLGDTDEPVEGKGGVVTPIVPEGYRHIYHQFVIRADRRDELMAYLNERDIGARIYYPIPLHQQECFADLGYKAGDMPVAEQLAKEVLAFPVYPEMTREMLEYVADQVAEFYGK